MRKFMQSFVFAWNGIRHGILAERNTKLHLLATIIVILAGILTGLSQYEWFIVVILISGMLALELMNSAVERVVDLVTDVRHPLAKQAKDLAAGAVLMYAIGSAIIGLIIFLPKWFN
ncbi:diacylglycerol kinase family protein [Sporosarcina sp. ANT_H38]|uniref:diacylglycerol kinase family protein n=1 Tax=Sporosarcina sp. ANT_H38 TaxID=2597358 RepID=UPI0011F12E02|nr:diacylglycerol kinase family protein [Sporosarcina sp. ANT_H38]KAA0965450.1 diacylglycerol kinase family protein [Sporosarcina sp. ANT_H38]